MSKKSVISLISYDAHFLPESIKSYYNYVDEIILGLDEQRISWSKNKFTFNEGRLWSELKKIDINNKIQIVEGNFHKSNIPIENDTFQRNFLKSHCFHDWIFSFDADEVLINAKDFFIDYLPIVDKYHKKADLIFTWFFPYKKIEDKYLIIANEDGTFFNKDVQGFATNKDKTFTYCRWTNNNIKLLSPLAVMHFSFCRDDKENQLKIDNYGHSDRTKEDPFYNIRQQITLENYTKLQNFKTSNMGEQWPRLVLVPEKDLWNKALQDAKRII